MVKVGHRSVDCACASGPHAELRLRPSQRNNEFARKLESAVEEALGARREEMYEIVHLGTMPERQRRGYATTLVRMVTDMVRSDCIYRTVT